MTTLYREIDALGGKDDRSYCIAINHALNILTRRGFTKASDPAPVVDADREALVERAFALVKAIADQGSSFSGHVKEACAIIAALEPVDQVIVKARELRLRQLGDCASEDYKRYLNQGVYDKDEEVVILADAIRYGIALGPEVRS